ncbi:MAG: hypothetical protein IPN01_03425 [Deltaproteobacteria bacterium]|nr:hypothetical protein [Deltaproteobacteria bacterium]
MPLLLALAFACGQPAPPAPAGVSAARSLPRGGPEPRAVGGEPARSGDLRFTRRVRPADAQSFGICRGKTTCEEQLGPSPGELPPGDYVLRADLLVPRVGEGWAVEMAVNCEITTKTGKVTKWSDKRTHPCAGRGRLSRFASRPCGRFIARTASAPAAVSTPSRRSAPMANAPRRSPAPGAPPLPDLSEPP